jgi:heme-degrading monooxygenase HmoA
MLARVTTFQAKLDHADEGASIFQEGIPAIRDLEGFKDAVLLVNRETGAAMTIALWADQQTMQGGALDAGKLFQKAAHTIDGEPERQAYEVLEHRPGQNRKFARVSTGTVDPSAFDTTNTAIIEAASQQPGYAGFLMLANRESNTLMGMSFWDSQEHLDASESGYYTREMDKSRDQFEGGQWSRDVYEVAAQG